MSSLIQTDNERKRIAFGVDLYGSKFDFIPESVINKGVIVGDEQFWLPKVIDPEFQQKLSPYLATPFSVSNIDEATKQGIGKQLEENDFADTKGYLIPSDISSDLLKDKFGYYVNEKTPEGLVYGPISGLATNEQGVKYYNVSASGLPGATGWISPGANQASGQYVIEKKDRWYESPLGILGGALLIGSGLGLAGIGPLAAGGAAAGGAAAGGAAGLGGAAGTGLTAGAAGTTGLTAGAAGVTGLTAPAGFALAPTIGAGAASLGILDSAQFGQTGQTGLTPGAAGQGLQTPTTPGLSSMGGGTGLTVPVEGGTVSQLGFVPGGATPVLGDPSSFINNPNVLDNTVFTTDKLMAPGAATGMSATDALRLANQARGLLGAGQNPIVPQQQGLPQGGGQAQGVDYSGLLSLLQLQAKTPGVSSLTQPAQLRQMYQTTLLPNVLSLLG